MMEDNELKQTLLLIETAHLGNLADFCDDVATHDLIAHHCPDSGEVLSAIATRLRRLHDGVLTIAKQRDARTN